jgi:hypothetical protein
MVFFHGDKMKWVSEYEFEKQTAHFYFLWFWTKQYSVGHKSHKDDSSVQSVRFICYFCIEEKLHEIVVFNTVLLLHTSSAQTNWIHRNCTDCTQNAVRSTVYTNATFFSQGMMALL